QATEIIMKHPGVGFAVGFSGFSGATRSNSPNAAAIFIGPASVKNEGEVAPPILTQLDSLQQTLMAIPDANIFVVPPPPVQGLGTAGGYKFLVQDRKGLGAQALQRATDELIAACYKEPTLAGVFT